MSLKEIQVLARRQVDVVEVVRLEKLKSIGRFFSGISLLFL